METMYVATIKALKLELARVKTELAYANEVIERFDVKEAA
jgi:hypothetical protein